MLKVQYTSNLNLGQMGIPSLAPRMTEFASALENESRHVTHPDAGEVSSRGRQGQVDQNLSCFASQPQTRVPFWPQSTSGCAGSGAPGNSTPLALPRPA